MAAKNELSIVYSPRGPETTTPLTPEEAANAEYMELGYPHLQALFQVGEAIATKQYLFQPTDALEHMSTILVAENKANAQYDKRPEGIKRRRKLLGQFDVTRDQLEALYQIPLSERTPYDNEEIERLKSQFATYELILEPGRTTLRLQALIDTRKGDNTYVPSHHEQSNTEDWLGELSNTEVVDNFQVSLQRTGFHKRRRNFTDPTYPNRRK